MGSITIFQNIAVEFDYFRIFFQHYKFTLVTILFITLYHYANSLYIHLAACPMAFPISFFFYGSQRKLIKVQSIFECLFYHLFSDRNGHPFLLTTLTSRHNIIMQELIQRRLLSKMLCCGAHFRNNITRGQLDSSHLPQRTEPAMIIFSLIIF